MADGQPWRLAVSVNSSDKGGSGTDRSVLLYRIVDDFRHPILTSVKQFKEGFHPIAPGLKNGGLDYIRGHLFDPQDMRLLPPGLPGGGNDLNDLGDAPVSRAVDGPEPASFCFGQSWG